MDHRHLTPLHQGTLQPRRAAPGRASSLLEYATPLGVAPIDGGEGGFVIPLAYEECVDWLKNVLAQGSATIDTNGEIYLERLHLE
jgi:hypothetical protein